MAGSNASLERARQSIKLPSTIQKALQGVQDAKSWFRQKLSNVIKKKDDFEIEQNNIAMSYKGMKSDIIDPFGRMSFFIYTAKNDAKLPYWDASPLCILYNEDAEHFYGLNLHYVHPMVRVNILKSLIEYMMEAKSERAYLNISYSVLKSISTNKYIRPCVKTYLKSNFRTRPIVIKPEFWHNAVMLPTATWRRASNNRVWRDSSQMF